MDTFFCSFRNIVASTAQSSVGGNEESANEWATSGSLDLVTPFYCLGSRVSRIYQHDTSTVPDTASMVVQLAPLGLVEVKRKLSFKATIRSMLLNLCASHSMA